LTSGAYLVDIDLGSRVGPALHQNLRRAHEQYARLSPKRIHRVYEDIGHRIPREHPELVVDAIRWVINSAAPG
jgi:pimeloyl-ACP methyl ester carboxylesterase